MHGEHESGTDSRIKIFGNIFISFIGSGILGLPYAFMEAGIFEGIIVMSLVGIFSVKAMLLLIDCKDKIISDSKLVAIQSGQKQNPLGRIPITHLDYGEVGFATFGSIGKFLVDFSIIVSQVGSNHFLWSISIFRTASLLLSFIGLLCTVESGFNCAYLIFISENIYSVIPFLPKIVYVALLLVPLTILCNLRHLKALAPFSLFADFANIFAYSIVFWFDMEHLHLVHYHIREISLAGLPFFLGVSIYCYEGAGMVLSLEQSVLKERRGLFRSIFKLVLFLVTLLYIFFGVMGYLSFGPSTHSIITLNLPSGPFPLIVKSCLCFSLFFTYPVSEILEKRLNISPENSSYSYTAGCVLRLCLVVLTGVIVLLIPNFSILMALVGSSCCTLLAFILPALFHAKLFKKNITHLQILFDIVLVLIGLVGAIIGTQDALKRLFMNKTTGLTTNSNNSTLTT